MPKRSIFILGDSITLHYSEYLQTYLKNSYALFTKDGKEEAKKNLDYAIGGNGGDSRMVLSFIENEYNQEKITYNYLLLNCGLHDIKTNQSTGERQVSISEYRENLEKILTIMKKCNVNVLWVSTTKVDDFTHNNLSKEFKRYNKDVLAYNAVANEIMQKNGIPIIDLYAFTNNFETDAYCDHVHYIKAVRALQAAYISGALAALIN